MDEREKLSALARAFPAGSRWEHVKRGTVYTVTGHAMIEATWQPGVRYVSHDSGLEIVRDGAEFADGRFRPMSANQ